MTDIKKPTREEAQKAVETLLAWANDDPNREGLKDTPRRVVDAYAEYFSGYMQDPKKILSRTFEEIDGYNDMVLLKNMRFESHCEHHMAPMIGVASIAYLPDRKIVGLSKIARLLDIFSKRLQTQENMTSQIANSINEALQPRGVMVVISAEHQCMSTRGVYKPFTDTITSLKLGEFKDNLEMEKRFYDMISIK